MGNEIFLSPCSSRPHSHHSRMSKSFNSLQCKMLLLASLTREEKRNLGIAWNVMLVYGAVLKITILDIYTMTCTGTRNPIGNRCHHNPQRMTTHLGKDWLPKGGINYQKNPPSAKRRWQKSKGNVGCWFRKVTLEESEYPIAAPVPFQSTKRSCVLVRRLGM